MDTKLDPKWESITSIWLCSYLLGIVEEQKQSCVFEKKLTKHPAEIILHPCALMSYWAGLFTPSRRGGRCGHYAGDRSQTVEEETWCQASAGRGGCPI
jgi:hypothetical protein